mgnify:CR=1 FL=1
MIYLYLHGLHGTPNRERIAWIRQNYTHQALAPQIDYVSEKDTVFERIAQQLQNHPEIRFIFGVSMGGYLAFHLGEYFGLPTVTVNPALGYRSTTDLLLPEEDRRHSRHLIFLGLEDTTIPPETTHRFLESYGRKSIVKVVEVPQLGHRLPYEALPVLWPQAETWLTEPFPERPPLEE